MDDQLRDTPERRGDYSRPALKGGVVYITDAMEPAEPGASIFQPCWRPPATLRRKTRRGAV